MVSPQFDGPLRKDEFFGNDLLHRIQPALLSRVVFGKLPQGIERCLDALLGEGKAFDERLVGGDDEASLAGLGLGDLEEQDSDRPRSLVGMFHPVYVGSESNDVAVGGKSHDGQNQQSQAKGQVDLVLQRDGS